MSYLLMPLLGMAAAAIVVTVWTLWLLRRRDIVAGPIWAQRPGRLLGVAAGLMVVAAGLGLLEPRTFRSLLGPLVWTVLGMLVAYVVVQWRYSPQASSTPTR